MGPVPTALEEMTSDGAFKRGESGYRDSITADGSSGFPAAAGRYHLYISYACPWASRCYAFLKLKGLEDAIGVTVSSCCPLPPTDEPDSTASVVVTEHSCAPRWKKTREGQDHMGWPFPSTPGEVPDADPDPLNGAHFIRDLYEMTDKNPKGKFSVPPLLFPPPHVDPSSFLFSQTPHFPLSMPSAQYCLAPSSCQHCQCSMAHPMQVLWDKEKKTIVNNESAEITRMFNDQFNAFAKRPELDLYPPALRAAIDEVNGWVYDAINNGVYKSGFATKQKPYEEAVAALFEALDRCEDILAKQRYLAGDVLTEADVRLFVTLIRFDEVYHNHFRCNRKLIREYPNLFNYTKDIYQQPGIADTVNMMHIKEHYYGSHPSINPFGLVPVGPGIDYNAPHDRAEKFGKKQ
eukprot:SM000090S24283  [mRNA]  locus=s90:49935:51809:- [translate_table: standard]